MPTDTAITIRPANLASERDRSALVSLLDEYCKDVMGGGSPLPKNARMHLCDALAERSNAFVFLAFADESPAGIAICFEGFSTFACKPLMNLHDFAVHPRFRGQGIAHRLLLAVEELARGRGCCKLTLEVLEGNQRAQKVYREFGFAGYELDPKMGRALFFDKKL
ncbi:GNAT family N-acetyltransferase [Pelagicoccus sp. SDUM812003]|uniref:GNAT family N-acetyltransferase n=1 Tax=Pelagicoccus sp. SDUM812003 TaxID=3041267 RepID=UPI00280C8458|nr:GNAT family N-acetyltransferase [Pelagicoccus sp. SDUM812003]MDQ8201859.1 GNAT family N-acetyltransferase [Pelagicoccus sp. SDUM812003]